MLSCVLSRCVCQTFVNRRFIYGLFVLRTATSASKPGQPINNDSEVTYEQLKTMLSGQNIQLIDVRNPDEFLAGRIPESINIPLNHLEESLKLSSEHFERLFEVKVPRKHDDNIVFQCQRGNRSMKALDIARQLGFSRARHYKGGYVEWAAREGK